MAQEKKNENRWGEDWEADTMELDRLTGKSGYLNQERGILVGMMESGLNTSESVFDRTAVFHVDKSELHKEG